MRVAIAKRDMSGTKTAASNIALEQTAFLSAMGHEVFVIAENFGRYGKDRVKIAGGTAVSTFNLPLGFGKGRYFRRKFFASRTQAWIERHHMDFVIGHGDIMRQNLLYMHNCVHLAHERLTGKPLPADHDVGRMHGELLRNGVWDVLVCSSEMMRADLMRRFDLPADKTTVIYPAFDIPRFEASKEERGRLRKDVRERFKIDDETILISLITSGDLRIRNARGLIDAFSEIASIGDVKLLIAAKEKFAPFIAYAKSCGLNDRVIFVPPIDDAKRYFFASDIFALPAFIETFSRACIEAMFCSLPVLVSPFVGASEILTGESRRFILPDLQTQNIASGLRTLIENPALRRELGEINHRRAKEFSAGDALARLSELLPRQKL
ncbi:MAG: glycosyltransferase family 4 protein [Helicobacteraceae bacterium]|jgi:UDP-glucose:(heptosyl)LPS alpha-1,3-glucosyltransferase|nr:glycosyltransferase family 4 protein [Helicobacteraceae bacterium]